MTLIQAIRWSGGEIELDAKGGLSLRRVSPALVERVKAERKSLISSLRTELFVGVKYRDSRLYWAIEELFLCVKRIKSRGVESQKCDRLTEILFAVDEAAEQSLDRARFVVSELKGEIDSLVEEVTAAAKGDRLYEGEALAGVIGKVFETEAHVAAAEPARKTAALDLSAFAGQTQGGLFGG